MGRENRSNENLVPFMGRENHSNENVMRFLGRVESNITPKSLTKIMNSAISAAGVPRKEKPQPRRRHSANPLYPA
jgi:hypothetical protein